MTDEPSRAPTPPLRPGDEVSVHIDSLAYGGEAVGRYASPDGKQFVLFVSKAAPGEVVRARVRRLRRRHGEADVVAVEQASPDRVEPRCPHVAQGCGGCSWQHIDYQAQLAAKQGLVRDSLERLGGFRDLPLRPIIAATSPWYFRNKMQFAFHPLGGLGLHVGGAWDRIFTLETCLLQSALSVEIVKTARAFVLEHGVSLYDPRTKQGFLRELVIRNSVATGEIMVGIVTTDGPQAVVTALGRHIAALDARITSVLHAVSPGVSDAAPILRTNVLHGNATITEATRGLKFQIALTTFFQTNTAQAEQLVDLVREQAGPGGGVGIDLYCGVGLFSLALASQCETVAGIEIVSASIEAARQNAELNHIENATFHVGDARTALPEVLAARGTPRVFVLDPPRAGAGGKVMRRIARSTPERIVYVSCNPTTLARDLGELGPFGYRITNVQPVDLFPQTYHVETVVTLER